MSTATVNQPTRQPDGQPINVISLPSKPKPRAARHETRFAITPFSNRSGTTSYRVSGYKRTGERVRENYTEQAQAQARRLELETEYLGQQQPTTLRATKLTDEQLQLAEAAFLRLENPADILPAVDSWLQGGKERSVAKSPKLDEAVTEFNKWLDTSDFRERTKQNLKARVGIFANSVPNLRIADITSDTVYGYLAKRIVAKASKDNDRRALSRFFAFCIERPRQWTKTNPARKETRERRMPNGKTPEILPLEKCRVILDKAEKHRRGRLAPYVALCLFGGLRPFEAARVKLDQINLKDREIRLEPSQTKTKTGRVVSICDTLYVWLKAYKGKTVYPVNWRKDFDLIKAAAGYGNPKRLPKHVAAKSKEWQEWPDDVLRHTAISHYFRRSGSYGLTAEQFGNSEAIIKRHYQGRVSSDDTKTFYSLLPKKAARKHVAAPLLQNRAANTL